MPWTDAFPRRTRLLAGTLLLGLVVVAASSGLVVGGHPPLSVCGVCGSVDGATDAGTLDVHVDEHGDSRWVARVPVNDSAAETYRNDPAALEAAVDEGWYQYDVAFDDARDVEASIDDGLVRVDYAVPNVAESRVGDGWVFDYLYAGGTQHRYDLEADRVTIHVPEGARVTNAPPNARIEDGSVTWTKSDPGENGAGGITSRTYVTYGSSGVTGTLGSWSSAAVVFGPLVLSHGVVASLAPIAVVGLATVVTGRLGGGRFGVATGPGRIVGENGRALLSGVCDRFGWRLGRRAVVGFAVGSVALLTLGVWLAFGAPLAALLGPFGLATALFLPLGYALERGDSAWRFGLPATASPLVATTALAPYYGFGIGPIAAWLLFVPLALGAGVLGYALSMVGRYAAGRGSDPVPDGETAQ